MNQLQLQWCAVVLGVGWNAQALALGEDGTPIDTSDYTVDFHEGPVLQSSRVIGLGGAVATLAEGVTGISDNPATIAVRAPWSHTFFDWELSGSASSPSLLTASDFDNNGSLDLNGAAFFLTLGAGLQFGEIGLGINIDSNEYPVRARDTGQGTELTVAKDRVEFVLANLFLDGQLAVGVGLGAHSLEMRVTTPNGDEELAPARVEGGSLQFGLIWAPVGLPLRAAFSTRFNPPDEEGAVPEGVSEDEDGHYVALGYYFPARITPATVLQAAVTTQFFRRLNGPWISPPKKRGQEHPLPPEFTPPDYEGRKGQLQATVGLKVTLPLDDGVGMESFLRQEVERSGRSVTFSPRLGVEGEPWVNGLIVRGGSYFEPSRFEDRAGRLHGTLGVDIHIPLPWNFFGLLERDATFRIGGALDRAPRYFGWSASLGLWH